MESRLFSVVLPVYNEHDNIAVCLRLLWAALRELPHEILVCYDFDEDTTLAAIAAMSDKPASVRLVKNTLGKGAANALRAGFAAARGDVVVTTMADLSDPPERIPAMVERARAGAAVVSGSRYVLGGTQSGGPLLKRTLSRAAGLLLRAVSGVGTHDATTNFRAYSKEFLSRTPVESRAGFEIALELTAKAHAAGLRVDEEPSSWVDRSAGTSRFQLWKWLPSYLRWWWLGARAALVPWLVLLTLFVACTASAYANFAPSAPARALLIGGALLALGSFALARELRGSTRPSDASHALIWVQPLHLVALRDGWLPTELVACGAASLVAFGFAPGVRRVATWLRGSLARLATQRAALVLLFVALLWVTRLGECEPVAGDGLDASWQQVMGWALANDVQFGERISFTFGPLGWFARPIWVGELDGVRVFGLELVLKLVCCAWIGAAFARLMSRPIDALLFAVGLLLIPGTFDAHYFTTVAAIGAWLLLHERPRTALVLFALACLWVIALIKFTSFALVVLLVAAVAGRRAWTRGIGAGARFAALAFSVLVLVWCCVGQQPWNLPLWLLDAISIAGSYSGAMSWWGPEGELRSSLWMLASLGVALLASCASLRPGPARVATAVFVALCAFVAFKAGFTRHTGAVATTFGVLAVLPYFLHAPTNRPAALVGIVARVATTLLALTAFSRVLGNAELDLVSLASNAVGNSEHKLDELVERDELRAAREADRASKRAKWRLEAIAARVGDATLDVFTNQQGVALLNGFHYHPRPIFQSYSTHAPWLLRRNAEFYAGSDAPSFVLFDPTSIDHRLQTLDDGLALQVLARDYRPVALERGFILLERRPREPLAERPSPAERLVLVERRARFGETIDLSSLRERARPQDARREEREKRVAAMAETWSGRSRSSRATMRCRRAGNSSMRRRTRSSFDANDLYSGLPRNEGYELVAGFCSGCHSLQIVMQQRHDARQWSTLLDRMATQGMPEPERSERATLIAYLSRNFGVQAGAP